MMFARFNNQVCRWRRLLLVVTLLVVTVASFAQEAKIPSLDFVETEVSLVLKSLADISGANIVIAPTVQGKITLKLNDVTLKEALDYVSKVTGLDYRIVDGSYIVGPSDTIGKRFETEKDYLNVSLKVLTPADATAALGNVYKDLTVTPLPGGRLVLGGQKERLSAAKAFLNSIDVAPQDVIAKPEVIESTYTVKVIEPWQAKKFLEDQYASGGLAIAYAPNKAIPGGTGAAPTTVWVGNTLVLRGTKAVVTQALATLGHIDSAPPAVEKRVRTERIFATQAISYLLDRYETRGLAIIAAPMTPSTVTAKTSTVDVGDATKSGQVGVVVRRDAAGKLNVQEPLGDFILQGPDAVVQEALASLATIDVGPERVERIYSLQFLKGEDVKKKLDELYAKEGLLVSLGPLRRGETPEMTTGSGNATTTETDTSRSLIGAEITDLVLRGPDTVVARAIQLLTSLDTAPAQVEISARIININSDDAKTLGVHWGGLTDGKTTPGSVGVSLEEQDSGDPLTFGKILRTPISLNAAITALETKHRAKTISRPHTTVQNGREASIHVGKQLFYETVTGFNSSGNPIFTTAQVSAGVTLNVKPLVSENGIITLEITTNVTDEPTLNTGSSGSSLPEFNENQTSTVVHLRDGETLVIGGLTQSGSDVTESGIPVLSKLPLIGYLFKSKTTKPTQNELMILVTPKLLVPGGAAAPAAGATP
ncbi:MAG: secretin and TonB N-terminal domain-containing protein [Armatimonadota bacterium]